MNALLARGGGNFWRNSSFRLTPAERKGRKERPRRAEVRRIGRNRELRLTRGRRGTFLSRQFPIPGGPAEAIIPLFASISFAERIVIPKTTRREVCRAPERRPFARPRMVRAQAPEEAPTMVPLNYALAAVLLSSPAESPNPPGDGVSALHSGVDAIPSPVDRPDPPDALDALITVRPALRDLRAGLGNSRPARGTLCPHPRRGFSVGPEAAAPPLRRPVRRPAAVRLHALPRSVASQRHAGLQPGLPPAPRQPPGHGAVELLGAARNAPGSGSALSDMGFGARHAPATTITSRCGARP